MRLRRILYLRKTRRWFSCKASARLGMLQIRFGKITKGSIIALTVAVNGQRKKDSEMSDVADVIFNDLIALQISHGGEIPPDLGKDVIRYRLSLPRQHVRCKHGALADLCLTCKREIRDGDA